MSAAAFGGIASRLVGRRKSKGDPDFPTDKVRSYSYDVNDPRAKPGRRIGDGSAGHGWALTNALLETFKLLYKKHRDEGYAGPHKVSATYLLALEKLLVFLNYGNGDFFVSYKTIAEKAGCSEETVMDMVECAEHWGLLCHVRRSEKIEGAEGQAGPQRKQACNGYFLDCKQRMPKEVYGIFWAKLMANLKKITSLAARAAAMIKGAFNSVAQPAPRTHGKELARQLQLLDQGILRRDTAPTGGNQAPSLVKAGSG